MSVQWTTPGGLKYYQLNLPLHNILHPYRATTKLKGPVGWDIFNCVNFANLIYMKLYSLLILTKNTKKSKNYFKASKKREIVIFPGRILPCKQNKSAIYSTLHHLFLRLGRWGQSNRRQWCLIVRTWGIDLQHWLSAQRWADSINKWSNTVGTFNRRLASV